MADAPGDQLTACAAPTAPIPQALLDLTTEQLIELRRLGADIDRIAASDYLDDEMRPLVEDDQPMMRTSSTEETRQRLSRRLEHAIRERGGAALAREIRDGRYRVVLGLPAPVLIQPVRGARTATEVPRVRIEIERDHAEMLLLLGSVGFELASRLDAGATDRASILAAIEASIVERARRVRAVAVVRRMAAASPGVLRAIAAVTALRESDVREWSRRLAVVEPTVPPLDETAVDGPRLRSRVRRAVEARQQAQLTGVWHNFADQVEVWRLTWSDALSTARASAACALALVERMQHLSEVALGPPRASADALQISAHLTASGDASVSGTDPEWSATLHIVGPPLRVGGLVPCGAHAFETAASREWDTGVSLRHVHVTTDLAANGEASTRLALTRTGLATSISVAPAVATRTLFDCDAAYDCLLPLPEAFRARVRDARVDLASGTVTISAVIAPWFDAAHPLTLTIASGRTTLPALRSQLEVALVAAARGWIENQPAMAFGARGIEVRSVALESGELCARIALHVSWLDAPLVGVYALHGSAPHAVVLEIRPPAGALAEIASAVRTAVAASAPDVEHSWLTDYVDATELVVIQRSDGLPRGIEGAISLGTAVPSSVRTVLAGARFRYVDRTAELILPADSGRRALEAAVRSALPAALEAVASELPQLRIDARLDLFGGHARITRVEGTSFDVELAWDASMPTIVLENLAWVDGHADLSGVRVSDASLTRLLDRIRAAVGTDSLIQFSNPRFAAAHLRVAMTLHLAEIGEDVPVGTIDLAATGVSFEHAFDAAANTGIRIALTRWLATLPRNVLEIPEVATLSEITVDEPFRVLGRDPVVSLRAVVLLAGEIRLGVHVQIVPDFRVRTDEADPARIFLDVLTQVGAGLLRDAISTSIPTPRLLPLPGERGPIGLQVDNLSIPVLDQQLSLSVGNIRITTQGIELPTRFTLRIPVDVPLGATGLVLSRPGITVDIREGSFSALGDIAVANAALANLIRIDAEVRATWSSLTIDVRGTTYFLRVLPVSEVTGQINLRELTAFLQQGTAGLVSRILRLRNRLDIDARQGTYRSASSIAVFGLSIYEATILADVIPPAEASVSGTMRLELPIFSADAGINASLALENVRIGAGASLSLGRWTIASARVDISLARARLAFSIFGLELAISVPGPLGLTPQLVIDAIMSLLQPDIAGFLENLSRGKIEIYVGPRGSGSDGSDGSPSGRPPIGEGDPIRSGDHPAEVARAAGEQGEQGTSEAVPQTTGGGASAHHGGRSASVDAGTSEAPPTAVPIGGQPPSMFTGGGRISCRLYSLEALTPDPIYVRLVKQCWRGSTWSTIGTIGYLPRALADQITVPSYVVWDVNYRPARTTTEGDVTTYGVSPRRTFAVRARCDEGYRRTLSVTTLTVVTPESRVIALQMPSRLALFPCYDSTRDEGPAYECSDATELPCFQRVFPAAPIVLDAAALPSFMRDQLEGRTPYDGIRNRTRLTASRDGAAWARAVDAMIEGRPAPRVWVIRGDPSPAALPRPDIHVIQDATTSDLQLASDSHRITIRADTRLARALDLQRFAETTQAGTLQADHDLFLRLALSTRAQAESIANDGSSRVVVLDAARGPSGFRMLCAEHYESADEHDAVRLLSQRGGAIESVARMATPLASLLRERDGDVLDVQSPPGLELLRRSLARVARASATYGDGLFDPSHPDARPMTLPVVYSFPHGGRAVLWTGTDAIVFMAGISTTREAPRSLVQQRLGWLRCAERMGSGLVESAQLRRALHVSAPCGEVVPPVPLSGGNMTRVSQLLGIADESWRDDLRVHPMVLLTPFEGGP